MADVSQWNVSAASNNGAPPDGAPEGMAPSTVNDVLREVMAAVARWYSDSDGTLETGGSGNAYTLTTNSTHAALADIPLLVFRLDRANTGAATLNVDGLGAKSMRLNGSALASGQLVADTVICAAYNATDDAFEIYGPQDYDAANLTGELDDARLSSNVPLKDAANTFTAAQTITATVPTLTLIESDAAADNKRWQMVANNEALSFGAVNDANSAEGKWAQITRTGTTIDEVELNATTFDFNGAMDLSGNATVGGALTATSYGGITEANLVDKSATETISGSWTYSANITMSGTRAIDATTRLNLTGATVSVGESGGILGFYGSAGIAKGTVAGSRTDTDGNPIAALTSLLARLEELGLITDNSTP